jgi:hypothetical protein
MKVLTSYNAAASTAQFSPRKVCFSSRARRDVDGVVIEEILPTGISCKGGPQGQGVNLRQPGLVHFFPKMYATTIQPSFSICGCMVRLSQLGSVRRVRGESQGID